MLQGSVYCDIHHSVVQYYVVANLCGVGGAIILQKWPGVVGSPPLLSIYVFVITVMTLCTSVLELFCASYT